MFFFHSPFPAQNDPFAASLPPAVYHAAVLYGILLPASSNLILTPTPPPSYSTKAPLWASRRWSFLKGSTRLVTGMVESSPPTTTKARGPACIEKTVRVIIRGCFLRCDQINSFPSFVIACRTRFGFLFTGTVTFTRLITASAPLLRDKQ